MLTFIVRKRGMPAMHKLIPTYVVFQEERCVDSRIGDKILCTRLHFYLTGKSGMVCKCTLTLFYKSLQIGESLSYYATKLLGGGL